MSDTDPPETESDDRPERRSRFGEIAANLNRSDSEMERDSSSKSSASADGAEETPRSGVGRVTENDEPAESTKETGSEAESGDGPADLDSWEWVDDRSDGTDETRRDRTAGHEETKTAPNASVTVDSEPMTDESGSDPAGDAESGDESTTGTDRPDGPRHGDGDIDDSEPEREPSNDVPSEAAETIGRLEVDDEAAGKTDTSPDDNGSIGPDDAVTDDTHLNTSRAATSTREQRLWSSESSTDGDDRTVGQSGAISDEPEAPTSPDTFGDASTGSDEYRRPDGLDLAPGTSVLIECGTQDEKKEAACHDMLGLEAARPDRNVILVRYRRMDPARLEWIVERAHRTELITVGYSQSIPPTVEETVETTEINNPNDITRLGILVSRTIKELASDDRPTVFGYDSLNVLLEYKDVQSTFRFLHVFLGTLTETGAIAHFHIDPLAGDPQKVNTLKPLFDEIVSVDSVGVHLE